MGSSGTTRKGVTVGDGGGGVIALDADEKESEGFHHLHGTQGKKEELMVVVGGRWQEIEEQAEAMRSRSLLSRDAGLDTDEKREETRRSTAEDGHTESHPPLPVSPIAPSFIESSAKKEKTQRSGSSSSGSAHTSDGSDTSRERRRSRGSADDETFLTATTHTAMPVTTIEMDPEDKEMGSHRQKYAIRDSHTLRSKALENKRDRKMSDALLEGREEEKRASSDSTMRTENEQEKEGHEKEEDCLSEDEKKSAQKDLSLTNDIVKNIDPIKRKKSSGLFLSPMLLSSSSHLVSLQQTNEGSNSVASADEESHASSVTEKPYSSSSTPKESDAGGRKESGQKKSHQDASSSSSSSPSPSSSSSSFHSTTSAQHFPPRSK